MSRVVKEGYLWKMGGSIRTWNRRWAVLHARTLDYYKDRGQEHKGAVPVQHAQVSEAQTDNTGFYFLIKIPAGEGKRTDFLMKTETEEERAAWMDAIRSSVLVRIFGSPLEIGLLADPDSDGDIGLPVPYVIVQACTFIEQNGLDTEGLYRVNASQTRIERCREYAEANENIQFDDVPTAGGFVKAYLRSLPDSLLLCSNCQTLAEIWALSDQDRIRTLKRVVHSLPLAQYCLTAYLFRHLRLLMEHQANNKMNARAISVCFAPLMTWEEGNRQSTPVDANVVLCEQFLTNYNEIFGWNPLMWHKSTTYTAINVLTKNMDRQYPFLLQAPAGTVVQTVFYDEKTKWTICVVDSQWGLVHSKCLRPVESPRTLLAGLSAQVNKWSLPVDEWQRLSQVCPEAIELHRRLSENLTRLREEARRQLG